MERARTLESTHLKYLEVHSEKYHVTLRKYQSSRIVWGFFHNKTRHFLPCMYYLSSRAQSELCEDM